MDSDHTEDAFESRGEEAEEVTEDVAEEEELEPFLLRTGFKPSRALFHPQPQLPIGL